MKERKKDAELREAVEMETISLVIKRGRLDKLDYVTGQLRIQRQISSHSYTTQPNIC